MHIGDRVSRRHKKFVQYEEVISHGSHSLSNSLTSIDTRINKLSEMTIRLLVVDAAFEIGANWICIDLCMHFEAPRTLGIGPRIT